MGKASKWLKRLFGFKRSEPTRNPAKKRWSFAKSYKETNRQKPQNVIVPGSYDNDVASRHAMAVAAATAAVAAAQAAAAVVKLTSGAGNTHVAESGGGFYSAAYITQNRAGYGSREEPAAVVIQSHYRAYLSRKALQALKAVVKLQALVRGQILRKHYVEKLREMKAIARAQSRARAARVLISYSSAKSSPLVNHSLRQGRAMQEILDYTTLTRSTKQHEQLMMLKRNRSRSKSNVTYDERSEKILEADPWKPSPRHKHIFHSPHPSHTSEQYCHLTGGLSPSSNANFTTAENSPQYYSASSVGGSSKRGLVTPTTDVTDTSRSYLSCYSDYPSYMACTQSSKAKVRSISAPKQRPKYGKLSPAYKYGDSTPNNQRAYSGSGHLNRIGLPIRGDVSGFGVGNWHRY